MAQIGFIGLGVMGDPMSKNLLAAGHAVAGFDLSAEARDRLEAAGGRATRSAAEAARGAEVVITMLPNGAIVREALLGDGGAASTMTTDALHIDMSTIHPFECDAIREAMAEKGYESMDVPVGRTSLQAIDGTLLLMAGGTASQIERARPFLMCLGDTLVDCGGPGMGARMKIINNLMSTVLNALTAEALTLSDALHLDRSIAIEVMSGTAAGRGHMTTTWPGKVLANDLEPVFMVDLARKDLDIALDLGQQTGVVQTLGAAAAERYGNAQSEGRGRQDWSALYAMLRKTCLDLDRV